METVELIGTPSFHYKKIYLFILAVFVNVAIILLSTPEQRYVELPALAAANIGIIALLILRKRDGAFPFFEVGTLTILAMLVYTLIPLLGFLAAGLTWNMLSDPRLFILDATPAEVGFVAWRYVVYLLSFVIVYLIKRGKTSALKAPVTIPNSQTIGSLLKLSLLLIIYFILIYIIFGYNFNIDYSDLAGSELALKRMPLFLQQISLHLFGVFTLLKLVFVIILLLYWHVNYCRYILFLWLSTELLFTVIFMGPRTYLAYLFLAVPLVYHRLVRPLKFTTAAFLGCLLLVGALMYGYARDISSSEADIAIPVNLSNVLASKSIFAINNEFQVLFANAYHILYMKKFNQVGEVPTAMYFGELVKGIPQQFLPFQKIDWSSWYLERLNLKGEGFGVMFGGVTQCILGWDWLELVLRGALLGFILALIHRWYVQRSSSFWVTLIYLWLCLCCYYTVRDTSFSFIWATVQRSLILLGLVKLATIAFSATRKVAMAQVK